MQALKQSSRENIAGKALVEYQIFDVKSPIIITFSPAGYVLTSKDVDKGVAGWAFELFKKHKINIISFTAINEKHWFSVPEVADYIEKLSPLLNRFQERLGYGVSMGAFASAFYANQLKLDRLLLITPMDRPDHLKNLPHFNHAADFEGKITLIYDPLCPVDKEFALMFPPQTQYLKFYSVGHQVIESISKLGFLKTLVLSFIKDDINPMEFAINARGRKDLERYYSYLKRNPTKKNTAKRRKVIKDSFLNWNLKNPTAPINKILSKLTKGVKKRLPK